MLSNINILKNIKNWKLYDYQIILSNKCKWLCEYLKNTTMIIF